MIRVLFIDDEVYMLNTLKRQISKNSNFNGYYITNPLEAEEFIEKYRIQIVVVDVNMPERDGIDLLKEIKEKQPEIIRILLTAAKDEQTAIRAVQEADVFGFITKPWDKNYLLGHLEMAAKVYNFVETKIAPKAILLVKENESGEVKIEFSCKGNIDRGVVEKITNKIFLYANVFSDHHKRGTSKLYNIPITETNTSVIFHTDEDDITYAIIFLHGGKTVENTKNLEQELKNLLNNYRSTENIDLLNKQLIEICQHY